MSLAGKILTCSSFKLGENQDNLCAWNRIIYRPQFGSNILKLMLDCKFLNYGTITRASLSNAKGVILVISGRFPLVHENRRLVAWMVLCWMGHTFV
jgi:hypothetical protein